MSRDTVAMRQRRMDRIHIRRGTNQPEPRLALAPEHPELDQPDGDLSWDRWLEGRQRLETTLLITAP